jgi:hypothetical protein
MSRLNLAGAAIYSFDVPSLFFADRGRIAAMSSGAILPIHALLLIAAFRIPSSRFN